MIVGYELIHLTLHINVLLDILVKHYLQILRLQINVTLQGVKLKGENDHHIVPVNMDQMVIE